MDNLQTKLDQILKLTKPQIAAFKKLGLNTAKDLLFHLPFRYLDFSKTAKIKELTPGENFSIQVKINSITSRYSFRGRMSLAEAIVSDDTGNLKITWFNQSYLAQTLKAGDEIFLAGQPEYYKNTLQLTNPIYEKVSDLPAIPDGKGGWQAGFPVHTSRLVPVYHLTKNLYPRTLRNAIKKVLGFANELDDPIPLEILKNQSLMTLPEAISLSHFPVKEADVENTQKRFNFEELLITQLLAQKYKLENLKKGSYQIKFNQELIKTFVESLPFKLTAEQRQSAWDILQDLEKPTPMNRLLEGDVGSGKTLVALIAALQTMTEGYQVALLCPTEILARQHYETSLKFFKETLFDGRQKVFPNLLSNNFTMTEGKQVEKKYQQKKIADGIPGLYIGTHALLQDKIKFKKLALVIIDEQHRFGVEQRSTLIQDRMRVPHLLSLSATPIPRTLKLALIGELDISIIKTKPQGRKPIITKLIGDTGRQKAYQFINQEIQNGRQAFVITPLIEEGESDTKSAKLEAENLGKIFPRLKIGLLHGKMKGKDKEQVMADFLANTTQILVSTSVVEVGVDVPNASVMVIEGSERFGLSQLHQFRGRVGRSNHQSYCFLFMSPSPPPLGEGQGEGAVNETLTRLTAFTKTTDGFELSELDLKQRGFGKLFGLEQSGKDFKYFDPDYITLIPKARLEAKKLLDDDFELNKHPLLREKLLGQTVHFE